MPRLFRALMRACIFPRRFHQQQAKETAMRDLQAPNGFQRCTVPGKPGTRSIVCDHGVRFEQDCSEPDPTKQRWLCACSNGNQDYIRIEVPALSSEQALQAVPPRLSNPTAEVEALSAGEATDDDCDDEYKGESSSFT